MVKIFELSNGVQIPSIGLGTWKSTDEDAYNAVKWAIEAGYRHIDTALIYGNEESVGNAIIDSAIDREELFVTSKVWNTDQGYEKTKAAIKKSLEDLKLDYLDLYLVHWFKGYELLKGTWKAMEEAYEEGLIKAIGVSNFNIHHLMNLLDFATIKPVVNQVETHIELQNDFLLEYCQSNGITLEAYAPLMSWKVKDMLENETMKEVASKHGKTIPQIALAWLNKRGIIALPKSTNQNRIIQNLDCTDIELDDEDMLKIKSCNKGNKLFPEFDNITF